MQHLNSLKAVIRQVVVGAVLGSGLAAGCGRAADKPKAASPDTWASVDGREIGREEVEKAYRFSADPAAPQPSELEVLGAKLEIVDTLITQELLLARAKASNLDATDAEVETAYSARKQSVPDDVFQQQLNQRNLTVDDMKRSLRRELTVQKVLDRDVSSKIAITDQEIGDFYTANRAQFNLAETQYHIAQIVITPVRESQLRNRKNDDATTPAEAGKKAQMLMERLRAGSRFSDLAMDYSEDPNSAPQGGDLGFVAVSALNRVPKLFRDAVLGAEPGNVRMVNAEGAHTLVLLVEKEAAGQRELSDPTVKDNIRNTLRQRKEQVLRTAYLTTARNDAKVVNHLARQIAEAQGQLPAFGPATPGKK